jgi:hypothetical protein
MIFDALAALLIFKIFGEQGLWVLGMTCAVTVLRTCTNFNNMLQGMVEAFNEEEEN